MGLISRVSSRTYRDGILPRKKAHQPKMSDAETDKDWTENFSKNHPRTQNVHRKVYVGGLGANPPRACDLEWEFAWYGKITNCWLARSPPGFGYIEYDLPDDAKDAATELNGAMVCGRVLKCEMANDVEERKHAQNKAKGEGDGDRSRGSSRSRSSRSSRSRSSRSRSSRSSRSRSSRSSSP